MANDWEHCNKKNLGKWIASLRNPRNKQTRNCLQEMSEDGKMVGNCCLGLVSKVSRKGKFEVRPGYHAMTFIDNKAIDGYLDKGNSYLTEQVKRWLGVTSSDPAIEFPPEYRYEVLRDAGKDPRYGLPWEVSCTKMNDSETWQFTFPQIADMLEYFVYNNLPDEVTQ